MKREDRYVVIKRTDLDAAIRCGRLRQEDQDALKEILERVRTQRFVSGKHDLRAVVVEQGWPEYEPTWEAILARASAEDE